LVGGGLLVRNGLAQRRADREIRQNCRSKADPSKASRRLWIIEQHFVP
jgi:hypothetical protein